MDPTTTASSTRTTVRLASGETTRRTTVITKESMTVTPDSPGTDGVMTTPTTIRPDAVMFVTKVLTPVTTTTRAGESRAATSGAVKKRVRSTMAMITVTPTTTSVDPTTDTEMSGARTPETTPMAGPPRDTMTTPSITVTVMDTTPMVTTVTTRATTDTDPTAITILTTVTEPMDITSPTTAIMLDMDITLDTAITVTEDTTPGERLKQQDKLSLYTALSEWPSRFKRFVQYKVS